MKVSDLTIRDIHNGLKKKKFSARELTASFFDAIKKKDKKISAFLEKTEALARKQSDEVDVWISQNRDLPVLAGVPMAVKDNILVKGVRCTAASKILENYIAPYDSTVIKRLKEKKSVILGKTNLDEFAMGSSTENSAFGPTHNPHDLLRVAGGSSGGSAAAVAAGECCYALGSDTGGSIRQPASFCGVVGLKPTYGAVSRYGLIAFASSLDQIGPITKNVEDAEIVFDCIKGKDDNDSTSRNVPDVKVSEFSPQELGRLRIGVPKEYFIEGIDKEVKKVVKSALEKVQNEGVEVEEISLPHTKYALASYYIIAPAEASANLARYDGIKYGLSESGGKDLLDIYLNTRDKGFGKEVKRRIVLGTYSLSSGYYEAYYVKAQDIRELIKSDFREAFKKVDLILAPVSPDVAFKIKERIEDPLSMYLADIYTVPVSLAGLPALSLPCGRVKNSKGVPLSPASYGVGLPVGLQIIGKPFGESVIFKAGKFIENLVNFS